MNADVAEAHELLRAAIAAAMQAGREFAEAHGACALEESAEWEQIGSVLVPALLSSDLARVAVLVGEPALPGMLAQRNQRHAMLADARAALVDAVLAPADADHVAGRRALLDERLRQARTRIHELRARPGVVDAVDAARRGQRVKETLAPIVDEITALEQTTRALEGEAARLGAVVARHHRARKELNNVDDQIRAVDDDALRDIRSAVVEALIRTPSMRSSIPAVRVHFHRVAGIEAKRDVLATLFERWVRGHGAGLVDLQQIGANVSGYETVSWPARVRLAVADAAQSVDAFRRVCASLLTSTKYEEVSGDWWAAFAPGVARDERSPLLSATPVDLATRAEDKLAAAWASLNDGARDRETAATPSPLPEFPEWPLAGETELLPSPPPRGAPSSDFDDFFNEAPARTPTAARDDAPGAPFAATVAVVETAVDNRFEAAAPRPAAVSTGGHAAPNFSPGSRVGRFGIEAMIGKGGMGEVYRARLTGEAGFRRVVVLKRLAINLKHDPEALRMFTAEAEVAARIAHPNVVQIFDVQTQGDEPFMVMEHLEGLSLLKLSQKARAAGIALDRPVLIRCALDAARGLHAAHSMRGEDGNLAGLVHRDVSPDNLFLCTNGFTKLLDFGIARRNELTTRTRGNELKGKIPYMSPEQILGERLDGRSDLFSLGSTLYQLLSGQRPFAGENDVTTLFAVVHKPHVPVHAVIDDAGDLGNVVERLLQKRASDRPSSALEVVEALERASPATPEAAAAFLARVWEA